MNDWISIHKRLPNHGELIEGKSPTGTWEELWNESEPLGNMTHWRPHPTLCHLVNNQQTVIGWVDNKMETQK